MFVEYIAYRCGRWASRKLSSWRASRQYRDSKHFSAVGSNRLYFMDVGVWAKDVTDSLRRPKSTFGLICENDILLCSWLNFVEHGRFPAPEYAHNVGNITVPLSSGGVKFLKQANHINRGYIVNAARTEKPLTPPDQLIIVVPDLHLHLYHGQSCDRFQMPNGAPDARISLDKELRTMLDIAQHCNAITVQIGDLYEVWESEIFLRMQYFEMVERGPWHREDVKRMLKTRKVIPRTVKYAASDYWFGEYRYFDDEVIKKEGVDFLQYEEICRGIRRAHEPLFQGKSQLLQSDYYQIDGNHDNQLENRYWSLYSEDYKSDKVLSSVTSAGVKHLDHIHQQIGTADHPIHIEHGHARDWHNNDRDWFLLDHGFDMVVKLCAGFGSDWLGRRSDSGGDLVQYYGGDVWTNLQDFEMRLAEYRRIDEIFDGNHQIKLVVMGHTHGPDLLAAPYRVHFGPSDPGWENYQNGEYWYKTDQQLREEAEAQKREEEEQRVAEKQRVEEQEKARERWIEHNWDKR